MKTTTKIGTALVVLLVAGATVVSELLPVWLVETQIQKYTTNAGELTSDMLVGQTLVAQKDNLSGVAVMFATYSGRNNTQRVELHVREVSGPSTGSTGSLQASSGFASRDVRVAQVEARDLRDNQFHRFEFEPIENSKGKTYFFFVVSPTSRPGDAVTVDLNTLDPYPLGTAFVARGAGPIEQAGKSTVDVVFETYHTVSAREAVWARANGYVDTFIGTWDQKRGTYWLWLRLLLPGLGFLISVGFIRRTNRGPAAWLVVLLVAAIGTRLWYAVVLPVTLDEGNYLYDAWTLLQGKLAGGDGYVKAPLVVAWIAVWEFIFRNTIMAGRMASVVAGALTLLPLYMLGRDLFDHPSTSSGQRVGLAAAAAWALLGPAIVFSVYVHTQPVALFLGISGLAILLSALRGTVPWSAFAIRPKIPAGTIWFLLAGVLLGLGVASRKSVLAVGLVPVLLIAVYALRVPLGKGKALVRGFVATGAGFLLVMALFLGLAFVMYDQEGVWEALGANSAEDGINVAAEDADLIRAYSLRGMTPFFRESMVLILLAALGLGVAGERAVRAIFQYLPAQPGRDVLRLIDHVVPKLGWLPALLVFIWSWSFFNEYEGATFHILGIPWLWGVMGLSLLILALLPRLQEDSLQLPAQTGVVSQNDFWPRLAAWLVGPLWVGGLVFFYMNWIKFHANYIAEFIPPLILLAGVGIVYVFDRIQAPLFLSSDYPPIALARKFMVGLVMLVMVWLLFVSQYITFMFPHTGTFDQASAREAAQWAREFIPADDEIFTGAALIPYLSGHRVSLDIAHPRWYAYEFTRKDTQRLNTFLPPAEEMVAAFREAKWFLLEQQTAFSFLAEYSDIERGLETDFVKVHEVENLSNPLKFYQRVR